MNHNEFSMITGRVFRACMQTLNRKAGEYARDEDRLHNFKIAGALQGITPEKALIGMWAKHVVSIVDMVHDLDAGIHHPDETWDEKIRDVINYPVLLFGLIEERKRLGNG